MDKLSKHSRTMGQFKELIEREKKCAKVIDENQDIWQKNLDAALERTKEDFFVVIMGNFSAGKSTMINALIGDKVLPSYPMPTTAVMTELRYGDKKKIIMYPKKGQNVDGHGDEPFSMPATEKAIEQYITIDNDAGINVKPEDSVEIASKFEKMELYWPLDMLKNGVVIVDSPGLNDPYSNDVIVKNYLPKADAIIYTCNSTAPYQGTDRKELEQLNAFGIKNILFAYTYWDMVRADGERAVNKTRPYCISHALTHTDLGENAVHFLASRDGLRARIEENDDLWTDSGYAEFAVYLQEYLTKRKGQDKVNNIVSTMESQAASMAKHATILDENTKKDKIIIGQNIKSAQEKMKGLEREAKSIRNTFALKLESKKPSIEASVKKGLRSMKGKINLDGFTPKTEFRTGFKKLNPFGQKKIATAIAEECQDEYRARLSKELMKYQSTVVSEELKSVVKSAEESIEEDIQILNNNLNSLEVAVGLPDVTTTQTGNGNPLLGIGYGLLTGDWFTGSTIAVYGGAGRQIGFQLVAGAGLGIAAALGAPITLPVLAITGIASTILGILTKNNDKQLEKIRKETIAEMEKSCFDEDDDKFINPNAKTVMEKVDEIFDGVISDMNSAINATFAEKEKIIQAMLNQANLDSTQQNKLVEARAKAIADLNQIIDEAKTLKANY